MRTYLLLFATVAINAHAVSDHRADYRQTFIDNGIFVCENPTHEHDLRAERATISPVPYTVAAPPLPKHEGRASLNSASSPPNGAATVPSDYVNPVDLVRTEGHLRHEVSINIQSDDDTVQLVDALSFTAPDWARYVLLEFTPDDASGPAGLYVRTGHPFQAGAWPLEDLQTGLMPGQLGPVQRSAYAQAGFRSESTRSAFPHYVLLSRYSDPAPAGRLWSVALGQLQSDTAVSGTLRVFASGSRYEPPLAINVYFDEAEQAAGVGFFDDTPRIPDGDNPGTTYGEALQWAFFRALEHLLDELDFHALHPIRVVATTTDRAGAPAGVGSSNAGLGAVDQSKAPPGRLRGRPGGRADYVVPLPVWERSAGTDACRAAPGGSFNGVCPDHLLEGQAGQHGSTHGWIRILRDHEAANGATFRWDLNFHDRTDRPNLINLVQHEMLHVLGWIGPEKSQAYAATFDPPRSLLDAPPGVWRTESEHHGTWTLTEDRQHFYGPAAAASPSNPWADTLEPGPRLQDNNPDSVNHLAGNEANDELGSWGQPQLMSPFGAGNDTLDVGVAREILLDVGYAVGQRSVRDPLLPRHYSDPERSGHGIDLRRVELPDGGYRHFLYFYTYDGNGRPEWYLATTEPTSDYQLSGSLEYVTFPAGTDDPQIDPDQGGTFTLDLDPPLDHPACADRTEYGVGGSDRWGFAVFEWSLDGQTDTWCLQPVQFGDQPAWPVEASGSWYAADPDDSGWGLSVITRNQGSRPIINAIAYHYDQEGRPTWSWGVAGGDYTEPYAAVRDGVSIEMLQFDGFCRTCPADITPQSVGELNIRFPTDELGVIDSFSVDGPAGAWHRENIDLRLLSSPHPEMFQ